MMIAVFDLEVETPHRVAVRFTKDELHPSPVCDWQTNETLADA
jgi:hypothetical protein